MYSIGKQDKSFSLVWETSVIQSKAYVSICKVSELDQYSFPEFLDTPEITDGEKPRIPCQTSGLSGVHQFNFDNLDYNTEYKIQGRIYNTSNERLAEEIDINIFSLKEFIISDFKFTPLCEKYLISYNSTVPAKTSVKFYDINDIVFGENKEVYLNALTSERQILEIEIFDEFNRKKNINVECKGWKTFSLEKADSAWKNIYTVLNYFIEQCGGDVVLGITAYLNQVKILIRSTDFSSIIPGTSNMSNNQSRAFEDQMSYYYALAASSKTPVLFIEKASEWFKYYNVNNIDPTVELLSDNQKFCIVYVIHSMAKNIAFNLEIQKVLGIISDLNASGLIPNQSSIREFYNQISPTPLDGEIVVEYNNLISNGIIGINGDI